MTTRAPSPDPNAWRSETPGHAGWPRSARPGDPNKYFVVSADTHANEPAGLWAERIDAKYKKRIPRVETDTHGVRWSVMEGFRPTKLRESRFEGEDLIRSKAGADPEQRLRDLARDGVDAEVIFPNKGLSMWATPDPVFSNAMCRVYNEWAWEIFAKYNHALSPLACVATGDLDGAIAEIERCAALGFRGFTLPCKPDWGPHDPDCHNYNFPEFNRLWACVQATGKPITFHVSTGRDPRAARGEGGAVINYVAHSLAPTIEPVVNLCASGVLERFPGIRFATIEAGIGWVAWALTAMDEGYRKHHMWAFPKLSALPSEYFRRHGFASFQEDAPGLDLVEKWGLEECFMWANDYPHHEGTWPHSPEAIERTMGGLSDRQRAKILGLNAAKLFGFELPPEQRQ